MDPGSADLPRWKLLLGQGSLATYGRNTPKLLVAAHPGPVDKRYVVDDLCMGLSYWPVRRFMGNLFRGLSSLLIGAAP
jgi:hypothetical protein